jgi:dTDP-4-amino-4,6-dideoxygalactose transaminase
MKIEWYNLRRQNRSLGGQLQQAFAEILEAGVFVLGPQLEQFEKEIANYVGCGHGIGVKSGTDALFMSLSGLGVGPGDEVITTPFTFVSSAEVVVHLGAKPVFCDIDPHTFNLDISQVEDQISKNTKAILPVHLYGLASEMAQLMDIAEKHSLVVVEDAAQALGAEYEGKKVGNWGHAACVSFYPTKNLSCLGDGGIILTDDEELTELLRRLRVHGSAEQYRYTSLGYSNRLDELQAAFLRIKLKHVDEWNQRRRALAERYDQALSKYVTIPASDSGAGHVYHQYTIKTSERDSLRSFLKDQGIPSGVYYPLPLHLQPAYAQLGYREGDFPVAEACSAEVLSLPVDPHLSDDEHEWIVQNVVDFFEKKLS